MSEHEFEGVGYQPDPDDGSDVVVDHPRDVYESGGRRKKGRGLRSCLAVLAALLLLAGGGAFAVVKGIELIKDQLASPGDYPGPGSGKVLFEVQEGDTAAMMGRGLKDKGVVKSVQAFTDAAAADEASLGIQVGFYKMKKEMAAQDALAILIDSDNLIRNTVTIPEGLPLTQIVPILAEAMDLPEKDFEKALANPKKLGLPDYANGNAEGYLFPATYDLGRKESAKSILKRMVDRWAMAAEKVDLEGAAERLGYTPAELMTVASLVQAEARGKYMPKVSRVIYNRLETDGPPTYGLLQLDATVNYAAGRDLGARTTDEDRQLDSPYNTYKYPGLPPGPIEAPGEDAMKAAAEPKDGPWLFYVTVNLATGQTKFATTLEEHNKNVEQLNEYCRTQSERC
jgi:peptidoglycan lytic transglycosylase G